MSGRVPRWACANVAPTLASDTDSMLGSDPTHEGDTWPIPHRSWPRRLSSRVARWTAYLVVLAISVAGQSAATAVDAPRGSLRKRVRKMRDGATDTIQARVIGDSPWCPALPDENVLRLNWRSAVSTLGRDRAIPVDDLTPVAIHRPRSKPGLEDLPRRYWILDVDGPGGPGSVAARIEDLALLSAAAGWPAPPGLTEATQAA